MGYANRYRSDSPVRERSRPTGITVGIGAAAVVVAAMVAATIPTDHPGWRFGVIALAISILAAWSHDQRALAIVAGIGALTFNGFLEDRFGQLAWHTDDLWRLLLLVVVGVFGLAVGGGYRYVHDLRIRFRMVELVTASLPDQEPTAAPHPLERNGS